ncbi:MAG: glycosyltransferase [Planctomycetota bacterium]
MRTLIVVNTFPLLSQTFIVSQITGLMDLGVDVRILAWKDSGEDKVHEDVTKYGLLDRVTYAGEVIRSRPRRVVSAMKQTLGLATQSPAAAIRCWNGSKYGRGAWLGGLVPVADAMKRVGPVDLVHAHFGPVGERMAKLRSAGVFTAPLLVTFHGYGATRQDLYSNPNSYKNLFPQARMIMTVSEFLKNRVVSMGADADKTLVHHVGIDTQRFDFRARQKIEGQPFRMITVARLAPKKGLPDAIMAVQKLRARLPDVKYDIIGDGPGRDELEKLIAQHGLQSAVSLLGWKSQDEVSAALDRADVFLTPSVVAPDGDMEGIPTGIMEASARGLPIVSTLHSGIPEIVSDGESGYLVPEHDPEALADRLHRLATEPETWAVMGRAGRAIVEEQFDTAKLNAKALEHYRTAVGM